MQTSLQKLILRMNLSVHFLVQSVDGEEIVTLETRIDCISWKYIVAAFPAKCIQYFSFYFIQEPILKVPSAPNNLGEIYQTLCKIKNIANKMNSQ